jgi:short-subunit dehydrogenase
MSLDGRVCVVTGASSGIGRALALVLVEQGAHVCAVGRSRARLDALAQDATVEASVEPFVCDLEVDEEVDSLAREILDRTTRVDVLVHSAGAIVRGPVESAVAADLERMYRVNLRAPFVLTQALLPQLELSQGHVVFVNSSAGVAANAPDAALYAATKHGLRVFADSLRQEVNAHGVRVLSVYPGRTATPMQALVHAHEGRPYEPERLMQPEDVVAVVLTTLTLSPTVEVTDVIMRPMAKPKDKA